MFDLEFWGEPISIYTDEDAQIDGILTDVSELNVKFNGKVINRIAYEAAIALEVAKKTSAIIAENLRYISSRCTFDGTGADAWGIFAADAKLGNEKFWLVGNEVAGYTLLTPSEY